MSIKEDLGKFKLSFKWMKLASKLYQNEVKINAEIGKGFSTIILIKVSIITTLSRMG